MPTLHPLCGDHAVVAARRPRLLGTARPGAAVEVRLAGASATVLTGSDGRWQAELPPLPPGGPHVLTATDAEGTATAQDVFLGAVWLGSGQSNMEWTLSQTKDSAGDVAQLDEPRLRMFMVTKHTELGAPRTAPGGAWHMVTPTIAPALSAVGTFFGRHLVRHTGLPVGMVVSAWGGSPIAPWMDETALAGRPEYLPFRTSLAEGRANPACLDANVPHVDAGRSAATARWHEADFDDSGWDRLQAGTTWQGQGIAGNGTVWYRTAIDLPPTWQGQDLVLDLGVADDCDITWVNGVQVGATGLETPGFWAFHRQYSVPATVAGRRLVISVRVFDQWGEGGLIGLPALRLARQPEAAPLPLPLSWRARPEVLLPLRSPGGVLHPASLFNGMIAPLVGTTFDGVIWYQGESDTQRAVLYRRLLSDLIANWRRVFDDPRLPFGIVSLAAFKPRKSEPSEDDWADLRDAQRQVVATVPYTGLAVALDLGEADDIHPRAKRPVGERLARWALHTVYGRNDITPSGPVAVDVIPDQGGLRVRFRHADCLTATGGTVRGLELQHRNGTWHHAEGAITGDTVLVTSAAVPEPVAVRYAWQANPEATLVNAAGLPAGPFRL